MLPASGGTVVKADNASCAAMSTSCFIIAIMPKTLQGVGCWNSYEKSFSNRTTLKNSRQMSYSRNAGRAKESGAVVSPLVRTSSEREHHATRHLHQANSPPGP